MRLICVLLLCLVAASAFAADSAVSYQNLRQGQVVHGFEAVAVYLNDADQPMGARFKHRATGFTLDLLQIQTVPQAMVWAETVPTSDMGEPHTQEHLLLLKGNRGRTLSANQGMSLIVENAYTEQWHTRYVFNTAAGPDVFFDELQDTLDALLHPDYTDEEIRREVRNFGVTERADKSLWLEEKGSVYNEMVSSFARPGSRLRRQLQAMVYGPQHPLALSSGGWPPALRQMQPGHIRKFHADHYVLWNMGVIASLPKSVSLNEALRRTSAILNAFPASDHRKTGIVTGATMPAPQPAEAGSVAVAEYPSANEQEPGLVFFSWPAERNLDEREEVLANLFLETIAGDADTNLYKRLVDTRTRELDTGATSVNAFMTRDQGMPVSIVMGNVRQEFINPEGLQKIRTLVLKELDRVAAWPDGSPELAEFNSRLRSRITETRRDLNKQMNTPPRFGIRSVNSQWPDHLAMINATPGFRKSLTLKPDIAFVEQQLAGARNIWRTYLPKWKLAGVTPYVAGSRPSSRLLQQELRERNERAAAEVERLKTVYSVTDAQEAVRRYQADYDKNSAELETIAQKTPMPPFIKKPPLTLDDDLDYSVSKLPGGIDLVTSRFDNMTGATVGLALNVRGVAPERLVYLSLLPELLTRTGVLRDGKPVSFEQMSDELRKQVLSLDARFTTSVRTGRVELEVLGAGNDMAESRRALEWMRDVLTAPNWTEQNLSRISDVVDQQLSRLRRVMFGAEESWVNNPANALLTENNPARLSAASFLTQEHNAHRLRWLLKGAGNDAERAAITSFLNNLSGAASQGDRKSLKAMLAAMQGKPADVSASLKPHVDAFNALPGAAKSNAAAAARDLDVLLSDLPENSLQQDWAYLCRQMLHDLLVPPAKTLAELNALRRDILKTGNARMFLVGGPQAEKQLSAGINQLVAHLSVAPADAPRAGSSGLITDRVHQRQADASLLYSGLMAPSLQGGVVLHSIPGVTYDTTDREQLLDYLASRIYGGAGAHGVFIKTVSSGMAYSNGLRGSVADGRVGYYAERTPEIPQTIRFVIDIVKQPPHDQRLVEYAVAQVFQATRAPALFEDRGEGIAADLADGVTPAKVRALRQAVLALRNEPGIADKLFARAAAVYGRMLPGMGVKTSTVPGASYFVIGAEKQLNAYQSYLSQVEGPQTKLQPLYPRDFWQPATFSEAADSGGGDK